MTRSVAPLLISGLLLTVMPQNAQAQGDKEKPAPVTAKAEQQTISIELRDVPIRKALERLFDAVKVDFMIEGAIKTGTVTARVKDKPLETVLKVLLEASTVPLTYERDGDVYIISPKPPPKIAPQPAKVGKTDEKPVEITILGDQDAGIERPQGYYNPNYYAPTYWVMSGPSNWQIGGLSSGQALTAWNTMGNGGLHIGAPSWPIFPSGGMFMGPQVGWGGFGGYGGGFLRFP